MIRGGAFLLLLLKKRPLPYRCLAQFGGARCKCYLSASIMEKSKWAAAISGAWHLLYLLVPLLYCGERWRVVAVKQTQDQTSAVAIILTLGDIKARGFALQHGKKRQ